MPSVFSGSLLFSHIIPVIIGFIGIILMVSGVMDDDNHSTRLGIVLFILAAVMPFIILSIFV